MMPPSLLIGEITVEPYEYEEDSEDDALVIRAKAILTIDQHEQIRKMQLEEVFHPVSRQGVDGEPRQMIFGMPLWSEHDTEFKHEIILSGSAPKKSVVFIWKNLYPFVAENKATISSLIEIMRKKGVIDAADELGLSRDDVKIKAASGVLGPL